jgi:hypothetical protein
MKIAVYGDSFGCYNLVNSNKKYTAWPEILKSYGHILDNYSINGNTFFKVYEKFKEKHKEYDINIFLIPRLGRVYLECMPDNFPKYIPEESSIQIDKLHLSSNIGGNIMSGNKTIITELLIWAELKFKYKINLDQEEFLRKELLMYSKTFKNNTIFIPCVDECIPWADKGQVTLMDILNFENHYLNIKEFGTIIDEKFTKDKRLCHLSDENNLMVATKIIDAINYKQDSITISLNEIKTPNGCIDNYIEWRSVA